VTMYRRSHRIMSLVDSDTERGATSEDIVEEALKLLCSAREIFHYYRASPNGELDVMGIDFLVYPEANRIIPLQVKSSIIGARRHEEKHDQMPCIVVDHTLNISELSQVILRAIDICADPVSSEGDPVEDDLMLEFLFQLESSLRYARYD
jgi:hypothetical protein